MLEALVVDADAVLRAWQQPAPAIRFTVPKSIHLPDSWTVVVGSTASNTVMTVNAWTGDVPLVADGHYSCGTVQQIRLGASAPAFPVSYIR